MMFRNSDRKYGAVTKTIHWVTALVVIGMLCLGLYMADLPRGLAKLELYNLHKSVGVIVLALVVLRILWHQYSKTPALASSLKDWEKKGARAVHFLLYLALLGMPMTGWLMSSAGGRPVGFFGLFRLPDLIPVNHPLSHILENVHGLIAYALIALIAAHFAGAMKHYFIDRDATLQRMLPFAKADDSAGGSKC